MVSQEEFDAATRDPNNDVLFTPATIVVTTITRDMAWIDSFATGIALSGVAPGESGRSSSQDGSSPTTPTPASEAPLNNQPAGG